VNAVEKNKPEKREDKLPSRLLFATSFEFISPYSVKECAYRMRDMNQQRTWLLSPKLAIYVFSEEENAYHFYMHQRSKTPFGWAMGELALRDIASTLVIGEVGIAPNELLPPIAIVPPLFITITTLAAPSSNPASTLSFLLTFWVAWFGIFSFSTFINLRHARSNLPKILKKILDVPRS
jgi:hypothetical protein